MVLSIASAAAAAGLDLGRKVILYSKIGGDFMRKAEWKGFTIGVLVTSLLTGGALAGSRTVPAELLYENIRIFMDGRNSYLRMRTAQQ